MQLPVMPPVKPMLAKAAARIPAEGHAFEPKWDGFRAIVFRDGDEVEIGSRNERPMTRYFPEMVTAIKAQLPERCVVDGELVIITGDRLDFEALQQRIHPAESRIRLLAEETPAAFVAFDLLALGDEDLTGRPFGERREALERALASAAAPVHLTSISTDPALAGAWFDQFEGAGLDGVVAKPLDGPYTPNARTMLKIKHERTADCVLAGYRVHKEGAHLVGSLLLGLYDESGELLNVGAASAFTMARRAELVTELESLVTDIEGHPWAPEKQESGTRTPRNAEGSRWSGKKDYSFVPLRPERVVEVKYDHLEGQRFRHTAQFKRWRPDREPASCTYEQLEVPVKYDLGDVLSG
ncbi:ATP-dependent DNA ligase [Phytomonospora endophytica]|uniref:DNA ligase (ATP) n=1 Tax=Phytomonospora endophytica TaxID=714109 RepID=A0A841FPP5_9ACTN|nr:ATP-dependent DNA ligase [Phytomonospora endophytica]MBB6035768.1 ATP-dependent DNA ligase [Phytomonospora endophytica]